ncbi:MAG TPA: hydantoinase/oxoprolinase family protein, partial [Thermoplasmata archaeon]|nr:hydantoinase/oxoprolinase family protein [Thermoplasmata archaeon]
LLAGTLPPVLLGGAMRLDRRAAQAGAGGFTATFGTEEAAVLAVQSVVRATMAASIRLALSKRGLDPRDFALLAFGGAGPMHAAYVARELGIRRILVPFLPGAFSAYGILVSDVRLDFGRTHVTPIEEAGPVIDGILAEFRDAARSSFADQGLRDSPGLFPSVDLRYVGQSYEVNVPVGPPLADAFHRRHEALYGYASRADPIELVTVRLTATIPRAHPVPGHVARGTAVKGTRSVLFPEGRQRTTIYDRGALAEGFSSFGPAIVEEAYATTVVPPGADFRVLPHGVLAVEVPP